jgi:hypothetical protein
MMANLYVQRGESTLTLEKVAQVGVAEGFLVIQYEDGTVVFERADAITRAQFDPDQAEEEEDDSPPFLKGLLNSNGEE